MPGGRPLGVTGLDARTGCNEPRRGAAAHDARHAGAKRVALLWAAVALALAVLHPARGDPVGPRAVMTPMLHPGQQAPVVMDQAGTFVYHCHIHPWMAGRVVVGAQAGAQPRTHLVTANDDGNATHADAMGFRDVDAATNTTHVELGDTVLFRNDGQLDHDAHLQLVASAGSQDWWFEAAVGLGLAVALPLIVVAARRT